MIDTHLTRAPASPAVDLRHLDGTLANLQAAARAVAGLVATVADARDRVAAAPEDPEARRAVRMALLQMRADATALAEQFATLAQPHGAAP